MAFRIIPVLTFDVGVVASSNQDINEVNSRIIRNTCKLMYDYASPKIDEFQSAIRCSEIITDGKEATFTIDDIIDIISDSLDFKRFQVIHNRAVRTTKIGKLVGYIDFDNYYSCRVEDGDIYINQMSNVSLETNGEFVNNHQDIIESIYNKYLDNVYSDEYATYNSTLIIVFMNIFITIKNWPMLDCFIEVDKKGNVNFV